MASDNADPRPRRTINIAVFGASGRLGHLICAEAFEQSWLTDADHDADQAPHSDVQSSPRPELVAAVTHGNSRHLGRPAVEDVTDQTSESVAAHRPPAVPKITSVLATDIACDVIVDASTEAGTLRAIDDALAHNAALLIATTGLSDSTIERLRTAADTVPVLIAPNTSLGIAVTRRLVHRAARLLGPEYDAGLFETHHRHKKDAPSGTSFVLRDAVRSGGGHMDDADMVSLRGGDVVGEHIVRFAGPGEYLEIRHVATSRRLFARGAIDAACWLTTQPAGNYTIDDLLTLRLTDRD